MKGALFAVRFFTALYLSLLCLNMVSAAVISGSVYDLSLNKESDAIVEINTLPRQLFVSKTGDYAFNVNPGKYILYAHTSTSESSESVIVDDDGNYTLDIILEEKLTYIPKDLLSNDSDIAVSTNLPPSGKMSIEGTILFSILILIVATSMLILIFVNNKNLLISRSMLINRNSKVTAVAASTSLHNVHVPKTLSSIEHIDEYESKVLEIIKKDKRVTQKDVRKAIPLSEAKISLIISDLESQGKIRKIKKGRGNILIFVQD